MENSEHFVIVGKSKPNCANYVPSPLGIWAIHSAPLSATFNSGQTKNAPDSPSRALEIARSLLYGHQKPKRIPK